MADYLNKRETHRLGSNVASLVVKKQGSHSKASPMKPRQSDLKYAANKLNITQSDASRAITYYNYGSFGASLNIKRTDKNLVAVYGVKKIVKNTTVIKKPPQLKIKKIGKETVCSFMSARASVDKYVNGYGVHVTDTKVSPFGKTLPK